MNLIHFLRVMSRLATSTSQLVTSTSRKSNKVRVAKDDKTFHFHESFLKHLSCYNHPANFWRGVDILMVVE